MVAVVLRGPVDTAPEAIVGSFDSFGDAERWAHDHPRTGGYCVAREVTAPDDVHLPGAPDS